MQEQIYIKTDKKVKRKKKLQQQIRMKEYNSSLENSKWKKASKITNERKIKCSFKLKVKPITNKYYIYFFRYLFYSFFIA